MTVAPLSKNIWQNLLAEKGSVELREFLDVYDCIILPYEQNKEPFLFSLAVSLGQYVGH